MTRPKRALWLINHATLRQFEVPLLQKMGYEVFLPKSFPFDEGNLSASVDYTADQTLTLSESDLSILNRSNLYTGISSEVREIVNAEFDIAFFAFFPQQMEVLVREFNGTLVLRPFGLAGTTYTKQTIETLGRFFLKKLERIEERFWFGQAYSHLSESETGIFRRKAISLPIGLRDAVVKDEWNGSDARIFFVCPRIGTSAYCADLYKRFKRDFGDLPFIVGGAQPVAVKDPKVLGFVAAEQHSRNMRELRVMYYHGTEPNHVHYHPFEAVRAGMPLIFMAGGMLDRLGGLHLPGRCETVKEARRKLERVLNGDQKLIDSIRVSQAKLLMSMSAERCDPIWRESFKRIGEQRQSNVPSAVVARKGKTRIAVILPVEYRGGSLRGAKLLANAIAIGGRQSGHDIEVVLGYLDDAIYSQDAFDDLTSGIACRPFKWKILSNEEAKRACTYAMVDGPLQDEAYQAPDDGINQFMDCDLWVIVSHRLEHALLPVRPHIMLVYDFLQRYDYFAQHEHNQKLLARTHAAEGILVTTEFTGADARQFVGVASGKINKVPMLAPAFELDNQPIVAGHKHPYFIWTTNLGAHKNHENAFKALRLYYEKYAGKLECRVTGVNVDALSQQKIAAECHPRFTWLASIYRSSSGLSRHVKIEGELDDYAYRKLLAASVFLWHPARIDNGTFSVVEAAYLGVPALSSKYPAMNEIDAQFSLNLAWMDPNDPDDMARRLKMLEDDPNTPRSRLPSRETLSLNSVENLACAYWQAIRKYL